MRAAAWFPMRLRWLALLVAAAAFSSAASATTLYGHTVQVSHDDPVEGTFLSGPFDVVVNDTVEVPSLVGFYSADISDTNIFLDFTQFPVSSGTFTGDTFNGFHLFDVNGTIASFLTVTINNATNVAGLDASRVSFDADNIYVNFAGLTVTPASRVSLDITVVPEPGTFLLMIPALAIFAAIRFQRRRLC